MVIPLINMARDISEYWICWMLDAGYRKIKRQTYGIKRLARGTRYFVRISLLSFWCVLLLGNIGRGACAAEKVVPIPASWESRCYLMQGVHYLMNEGNRDVAEELFRKAIFSSSFGGLSREGDADRIPGSQDTWIVAEALYFLGKIHYEKAMLDAGEEKRESNIENIVWARKYLERAEEYGIVYDRLHPSLLDEINRKYPNAGRLPESPVGDKAEVIIEVGYGSYRVDAVKISREMNIAKSKFRTGETKDLECGARYKVEPDIQGSYRSIYRALAVLGVGIMVWLTRG